MEETSKPRVLGLPTTPAGYWALGFTAGFLVLFPAWLAYSALDQTHGETFFEDPIHAVLLLSAACSAVLGGVVGIWAVLRRGERSILILPCVLLGGFVVWWGGAEIFFPH